MEVKVTKSAAEFLKKKIDQGLNYNYVRIQVSGLSCGGPIYEAILDKPLDTDLVFDVEGIKVIFDKESAQYAKGFEIDYGRTFSGNRVTVEQLEFKGTSCL